jgi:DNA integrity scanning protein DisA with diadenylate cyclase activity
MNEKYDRGKSQVAGEDSRDRNENLGQAVRSDADLAQIVVRVARVVQADAIVCATETGAFAQHIRDLAEQFRFIAATTNRDTYEALIKGGLVAIHLPLRTADKYSQVRHIISVALRSASVAVGDLVVCAIGPALYPAEGDLVVLTDVEPGLEHLPVSDLLKLTDGIRPRVLEAAVAVACKIGRAARRGKRIGAIFILGDSVKALEGAKQLIPNPFQGHDETTRRITNPNIHEALVELSKLDGAFVVRGDGFIQTAGVFLAATDVEVDLPAGLGARHMAAAAVTARTAATAIVVSATDGNVRAFSGGAIALQMDPDVSYDPAIIDG